MLSGRLTWPPSRSCTLLRNRSLTTSLAVFGRRAARSAFHCAIDARYWKPTTPGGGVAPQLSRHRRGRSADPAGDLAHPAALGAQQRDLLPLGERQIAARGRDRPDGGG